MDSAGNTGVTNYMNLFPSSLQRKIWRESIVISHSCVQWAKMSAVTKVKLKSYTQYI